MVQYLKLISRSGCERIIRYAFEYAKQYGRKKVTCFVKDNIMKQTDGMFHKVFDGVAAEYPEIAHQHLIVDIGAAKLANSPQMFDVIVMPNLYENILSDVAAEITGSVGLAGSVNIGITCAMFEAIHGSAPDIAGKNIANSSGLIQASVLMLNHIGENKVAANIQNAWLATIEDGIHTPDIYQEGLSKQKAGTDAFANAVIERLGKKPNQLSAVNYAKGMALNIAPYCRKTPAQKVLTGIDIFVDWQGNDPNKLAFLLQQPNTSSLALTMITNRGTKVWPNGFDETFCTDHWRCRYYVNNNGSVQKKEIVQLLANADELGIDIIKTENLYTFNGVKGFSLGQGE